MLTFLKSLANMTKLQYLKDVYLLLKNIQVLSPRFY